MKRRDLDVIVMNRSGRNTLACATERLMLACSRVVGRYY